MRRVSVLLELYLPTTGKNVCSDSCLVLESLVDVELDRVLEKGTYILFCIMCPLFQKFNTRQRKYPCV